MKNPCTRCKHEWMADSKTSCHDFCKKRDKYQAWYKSKNSKEIDMFKKALKRVFNVR